MSVFTLLTMAACNEKDLKAAEIIQQKLKDKYGQEFVVDRIGGGYGTLHTNTLKAIVYPKEEVYKKFKVEITKDLQVIWDSYMNVLMAGKLDIEVSKIAEHHMNRPYRLKTYLSSAGMSYPDQSLNDEKIQLEKYLESNTDVIIYFFVNSESEVNPLEQAEKLRAIATEVLSLGVKEAYIRVFFVKHDPFQSIDQQQALLFDNEDAYKYFSDKNNSYQQTWLTIEKSIINESVDDIEGNFK